MKIVLLGASGQLGYEWQNFFEEHEENVRLLPYTSSELDVTDRGRVADELEKHKPDAVVNCAAYTDVDGAEENRGVAQQVNAEAVTHLAELSAKHGFQLVHYSTDYVFPGKAEDRESYPQGYHEDHPADPINFYGQTKWKGEEAIRSLADNYLILRVSWLCGAWGTNFVKTMLQLGNSRDELQVVNDQWGSPTFTENLVQNSWNLLRSEQMGTFHITSKGLITWYDFAKEIFDQADIEVKLEAVSSGQFPTRAERPQFSKLDTAKLSKVSGSGLENWKIGLRHLLHQLRDD